MLNNDLPKSSPSPVHRATVASLINSDDTPPAQRQPATPPPVVPLPPTPLEESPRDDTSALSRKRPRIDDSPQPMSAVSPGRAGSVSTASSSVQRTRTVAGQSPVQRNNSVIMLHEPPVGLEPSIVNIQPSEELSRFISDFIFLHLIEGGTEHLEVHSLSVCFR